MRMMHGWRPLPWGECALQKQGTGTEIAATVIPVATARAILTDITRVTRLTRTTPITAQGVYAQLIQARELSRDLHETTVPRDKAQNVCLSTQNKCACLSTCDLFNVCV